MTSTAPAPAPDAERPTGPAPTSLTLTGRALLRRARWYLAFLAVLLVGAVTVVSLGDDRQYPQIDPRSYERDGAHAAYALLEQQGVKVSTTTEPITVAGGRDTLVLPQPDLIPPAQLHSIAAAGHTRLVLIAPGTAALDILAPGIRMSDERGDLAYARVADSTPRCNLPEAVRAGDAEMGGMLYTSGSRGEGCYKRGYGYALVHLPLDGDRDVIVIGSGVLLQNGELPVVGNASLALGLLGSQPTLAWHLPDYSLPAPTSTHDKTLTDFFPKGWNWAFLQLFVAALLAALWRGRRLGPVVSEDLPVVVRAAETTEGRARLYRRAKARGRAAEALRRAAAHRLAPALGIPLRAGAPDPDALCAAITDRRPEQPPGDVRALLYGPPPIDDAALLRLADDLDALERQVRNP
ncbi:DUF4350 domain-containing protein [Kitasatospora sp. NPDC051170]|uniref:DUF4350 domain-containing protein n=1 Tax=Kitasatospora sp. NPDC051170 TaxID=3364056 RepID=UPI003796F05A